MKMEGSVGSGVLKKKSSSGCLIIKKTGLNKNSGVLGGSSDGSKEKKRARLVASDSSSSDEDESLEIMRRRVNDKRLKNGSMGYERNEIDKRESDGGNAGSEDSGERKRSRMDLFDFDEYDEFDGKKMRNEFFGGRFKTSGKMKESSGRLSRNFVVDKRKQGSRIVGSSSVKSKGKGLEDDDAHMPISLLKMKYQEAAGDSIRMQGKNGVLKVMVNKKKKMDFSTQSEKSKEFKDRKGARSDGVVKKELSVKSPVRSDSKTPEYRVDSERSVEKEKNERKLEKVKPSSSKGRRDVDSEVDGTDKNVKLATPRREAPSSKKGLKKEAEGSPSPEDFTPVKGKEGNSKRGGSTEKQMLREKIRGMLLDAGWTIDYRPRRNRDYLDAVYINPSGTAYWSIIKAYDAFKKHLEEDDGKVIANVESSSFTPLSEDLINKLTRQTKKKIAEEMRRKRKEDAISKSGKRSSMREDMEKSDSDESEERLSSFIKQKQKSRGKSCIVEQDSDDDLSDDIPKRKPKKARFEKPSASKSIVMQGRTSKVNSRCTLLVRSSDRGENSDFDGYVPYRGKRTVLAWLIDSGAAKLSEKVQYRNRRRSRVMLEGWITRDGIHCGCCSKILTVSKFELHAASKLRKPFQNIFLESGSSLLQCQIDAWNSQEESERKDFFTIEVDGDDPDDDACGICGDGGDLICCDSCPSTFHQICLGIKMLPSGDWHCPNCTCKFCGDVSGNAAKELNRCHFCEKKYHESCSERAHATPMSSNDVSFCEPKCQEIYNHLEKMLGIKHELDAGMSWSLIQRKDVSDPSQRGFPLRVECNSKLAVALSVMEECFLPIVDRRSGINVIHNVVYNCGSDFNRLNFDRFYTVVLERGDEIISAASIRLHGDRLAEMPFIGTREIYRRQGMCRRLLSAIETELRSLKVGRLIIPAISEHMNTWTTVFDFHELKDVHKREVKSLNMLVFPGTDMLQKQLVKRENTDGGKVSKSNISKPQLPVLAKKSEVNLSPEYNSQTSSDSEGCVGPTSEDDVDALDPASPTPAENDDSSEDEDGLLEPSENARKNEAPSLKSNPDSPEQNQDSDEENVGLNAGLDSKALPEGKSDDVDRKIEQEDVDRPETDELDEEIEAVDRPETHKSDEEKEAVDCPESDSPDGEIMIVDHPETCEPDGEFEIVNCHEADKPDGEIKTVDHPKIDRPDGETESVDQPASGKPNGEVKVVDRLEPDKPNGETVDRPETDKSDGEKVTVERPEKTVGHTETGMPDGEIKVVDLTETGKPNGETNTVEHTGTGEHDGETKTVDHTETSKHDGEIQTIDHTTTGKHDEEIQIVNHTETSKPDEEIQTVDHTETAMPDGEIKTVDHSETSKPDGETKTIDKTETSKPNAEAQAVDHTEIGTTDGGIKTVHPETSKTDGGIKTVGDPETSTPDGGIKTIGVPDGRIKTVGDPETGKPDGGIEAVGGPETGKTDEENAKPEVANGNASSLAQNNAKTENHVQ